MREVSMCYHRYYGRQIIKLFLTFRQFPHCQTATVTSLIFLMSHVLGLCQSRWSVLIVTVLTRSRSHGTDLYVREGQELENTRLVGGKEGHPWGRGCSIFIAKRGGNSLQSHIQEGGGEFSSLQEGGIRLGIPMGCKFLRGGRVEIDP
jgi:hypothetical protein